MFVEQEATSTRVYWMSPIRLIVLFTGMFVFKLF